jgi:hypothetical protein
MLLAAVNEDSGKTYKIECDNAGYAPTSTLPCRRGGDDGGGEYNLAVSGD